MNKAMKKLIARWWKIRGACDSDEQMLGMIFMAIQSDSELGQKLVEALEHRVGR